MTQDPIAISKAALEALDLGYPHIAESAPHIQVMSAMKAKQNLRTLIASLEAQTQEPQPPFGSIRKAAMAVYKPPFIYQYGYIYDSQNLMVADNGGLGKEDPGVKGAVAARVRGWGRLGYLPNGAELQDEIGQMMADALNALYTQAQPVEQAIGGK